MEMNEEIDMIIARKLSGEASADDERVLDAWLAAADRNRAEYEQVALLWQRSDILFSTIDFDTAPAWDKVAAKTTGMPLAKKPAIGLPAWSRYVLAAAAVLLVGLFVVKPLMEKTGTQEAIAVAGNLEVTLPDNTHVTLRKGSKLAYPVAFAATQRNVVLEGEAFFEVARNESQPFVIDARSVMVKVLGTSFNVKSDDGHARVTVATGKVQMTSKQDAAQYAILTKGQYGTLAQNRITQNSEAGTNYLFWKTGILQYDNKPLHFIVKELGYYYQKKLVTDSRMDSATLNQLINISFSNQSFEAVLNELCLVARCSWQQKDGQYIILTK